MERGCHDVVGVGRRSGTPHAMPLAGRRLGISDAGGAPHHGAQVEKNYQVVKFIVIIEIMMTESIYSR